MSWRTQANWELRARVTPELLAGGLVIIVAVALAGALSLAQPVGTEPASGGSTAVSTSKPTASATPAPTATVDTKSVQAILVLNKRISEIATEAAAVQAAKPFNASDAAAVLRRLNATVTSARELAAALEREPRTAIVGSGLQTFYLGLKALSDKALKSSLSNAGAYRSALAEIPTRMSRLAALDQGLNSLLD
jgi:hypothetical protein